MQFVTPIFLLQIVPKTKHVVLALGDKVNVKNVDKLVYGSGLYHIDDELLTYTTGNIYLVGALVNVEPKYRRYKPMIGDFVMGRVVDTGNKKWKLAINIGMECQLNLAEVFDYYSISRGKILSTFHADKLFGEGDFIRAKISTNSKSPLRSRLFSNETGLVDNGTIIKVSPAFIDPQLQNNIISYDLQLIIKIGLNGFVWLLPFSHVLLNERFDGNKIKKKSKISQRIHFRNTTLLISSLQALSWTGVILTTKSVLLACNKALNNWS
jgi:exosome complex RNA-binding protein Rrp4